MADPTDAELLTAYKRAALAIATGQSYEINGRSLTRANLKDVRSMIEWLEDRIGRATDQTGGFHVASFGDPG